VRIRADAVDALPAFKESIERNRNGPELGVSEAVRRTVSLPGVTQAAAAKDYRSA
jgi:hypothetical protein